MSAQRDPEAVDPPTRSGHPRAASPSEKSGPAHQFDELYPRSLRRVAFLKERKVTRFQLRRWQVLTPPTSVMATETHLLLRSSSNLTTGISPGAKASRYGLVSGITDAWFRDHCELRSPAAHCAHLPQSVSTRISSAASGPYPRTSERGGEVRREGRGKLHAEGASLSEGAGHLDLSTHALHDAMGDRETETGTRPEVQGRLQDRVNIERDGFPVLALLDSLVRRSAHPLELVGGE